MKQFFSRMSFVVLAVTLGLMPFSVAQAQDAKTILKKAAQAAGGLTELKKLSTFAVSIKNPDVVEVHLIRVRNRMSYYRAILESKQRLEIVLAQQSSFVVDRNAEGKVVKVENLNPTQATEAGYDRDLFLLPVLLPFFAEDEAAAPKFEGKSEKGNLRVSVTLPGAPKTPEKSVRYTLKFSPKTFQLIGANSVIPAGPNKGKVRRVVFSNYKPVKNLNLPRQIRYKVDTDPVRTVDFKVKLNAKIAATQFLKPKVEAGKGDTK